MRGGGSTIGVVETRKEAMPVGGGLIGQLANGAVADRRFPESGDAEAVRKHLSLMQADGDLFDAVDDAEVDWLAYRRRWLNRPADA